MFVHLVSVLAAVLPLASSKQSSAFQSMSSASQLELAAESADLERISVCRQTEEYQQLDPPSQPGINKLIEKKEKKGIPFVTSEVCIVVRHSLLEGLTTRCSVRRSV